VELLVAVLILATAVVAIVGGLAASIRMSTVHRTQVQASAAVRTFAEAIEGAVAATTSGYDECAVDSDYDGLYVAPAGFTADVVDVDYWIVQVSGVATFEENQSQCTVALDAGGRDSGIQRLSLSVQGGTNPTITETLDIVIRRPCRQGDAPCG
jgi:type II secretory pathway pseudopilin PulG